MRTGPRDFLGIAALLAGVACGGSDEGRPSAEPATVSALDQCALEESFEFERLLTFDTEDERPGSRAIDSCQAPERGCDLYFNFDARLSMPIARSNIPEGVECPLAAEPVEATPGTDSLSRRTSGRCGRDEETLRLTAKNLGHCWSKVTGRDGWGGALDLKFLVLGSNSATQPLDASGWDGISLWVRKAGARTNPSFILTAIDEQNDNIEGSSTVPHCGCLAQEDESYSCVKDPSALPDVAATPTQLTQLDFPDTAKCDPYGAAITLSDGWTFVPVYFADMRQKGFGYPSLPIDIGRFNRFQLLFSTGDIDVEVDEISLFRKRP